MVDVFPFSKTPRFDQFAPWPWGDGVGRSFGSWKFFFAIQHVRVYQTSAK